MTTVEGAVQQGRRVPRGPGHEIRMALLGVGQVGSAIVELVRARENDTPAFTIASALVRDVRRRRGVATSDLPLTTDPAAALASTADVVVEVLGGIEPARDLVLTALERGTPVVTANKTLLAVHGDELLDAARRGGAPLLYEATALAGVPFLGTFSRRPYARGVTGFSGIVNGTTNFILSRMADDRSPLDQALQAAQRTGYAEPDPSKDLLGIDAAEKACVLLRHFGGWSVAPGHVPTSGILDIHPGDLEHAAVLGGVVRPVVSAEWDEGGVRACVGPAFVSAGSLLGRTGGVQNALSLRTRWSGELSFSGPGAGPAVTAATVLDDVYEAVRTSAAVPPPARHPSGTLSPPVTGWLVRVTARDLVNEPHARGVLERLGVRVRRASPIALCAGQQAQWLLTGAADAAHAGAALDLLASRIGGRVWRIPAFD